MVAHIGTRAVPTAVRAALERAHVEVADAGYGLYVPQSGPQGECCWIRPDGTVVAASTKDLDSRVSLITLFSTWHTIAEVTAKSSGVLDLEDVVWRGGCTADFYTMVPGTYVRLVFPTNAVGSGQQSEYTLHWPEGAASWASMDLRGTSDVTLKEDRYNAREGYDVCVDLTPRLQFGSHIFKHWGDTRSRGFTVFHASFQAAPLPPFATPRDGGQSRLEGRGSGDIRGLQVPRPKPDSARPSVEGRSEWPSARSLGFRGARTAHLGAPLQIGPVRGALSKHFTVESVSESVLFVRIDPVTGVWVFPDGRMTVATHQSLEGRQVAERLEMVWFRIAMWVSEVSADVPEKEIGTRCASTLRYFTETRDQLQRVLTPTLQNAAYSAPYRHFFSPSAAQWARAVTPADCSKFDFGRERSFALQRTASSPFLSYAPLEGLMTALYSVGWDVWEARVGEFGFEAFFSEPRGRISVFSFAGVPMVTRAVYSDPLSVLHLPWSGEVPDVAADGPAKTESRRPGSAVLHLEFPGTRLADVCQFLSDLSVLRQPVWVDPRSGAPDTPVTLDLKGVSAESVVAILARLTGLEVVERNARYELTSRQYLSAAQVQAIADRDRGRHQELMRTRLPALEAALRQEVAAVSFDNVTLDDALAYCRQRFLRQRGVELVLDRWVNRQQRITAHAAAGPAGEVLAEIVGRAGLVGVYGDEVIYLAPPAAAQALLRRYATKVVIEKKTAAPSPPPMAEWADARFLRQAQEAFAANEFTKAKDLCQKALGVSSADPQTVKAATHLLQRIAAQEAQKIEADLIMAEQYLRLDTATALQQAEALCRKALDAIAAAATPLPTLKLRADKIIQDIEKKKKGELGME